MTSRDALSLTLVVVCGCSLESFDYLSASHGKSSTARTAGNTAGGGTGAAGGTTQDGGETGAAGSPAAPTGVLDGNYQLVVAHSSKCLDTGGELTPEGNVSMQQLTCLESSTQAFTLRREDGDDYGVTIMGSDDCLDVEGASRLGGARVVKSPCNSQVSQRWLLSERAPGRYAFENALSGKCLDVAGSGAEDYVVIDQWACQDAPNQTWGLSSLTPLALPLAVDDTFSASAWSAADNPPVAITPNEHGGSRDCEGMRAPSPRGFCHSAFIDAFPPGDVAAGASWLHPSGNRGTFPGRRIAPSATRVRFQARGERGGEVVTFGVGGNIEGTFHDSFAASTPPLTLSAEWQSFSLDLTGVGYSSVLVGFYWRMEIAANVAPFQIYVDDIAWE